MSRSTSRPLAFGSRPTMLCRPAVRLRRSAPLPRRLVLSPVSRRVTSPASLPGSAPSLAPRAYSQVTGPSSSAVTSQVAPTRLVTIRRRPSAQAGPRTSNPCAASLAATARIAAPGSPLWAAALPQWSIAVVTGMCPPQRLLSRWRPGAGGGTRSGPRELAWSRCVFSCLRRDRVPTLFHAKSKSYGQVALQSGTPGDGQHNSHCGCWHPHGTLFARNGCREVDMAQTRPASGPTVLRMILGRQLQALREKAGMSYEQAAEAIYSSPWTIRRMEGADGGLKPLTVKSLLMAYGVTDVREIDTFLALSRDASKPGWWHSYDDVLPPWFRVALGLEESASLIRAYEPQVVPGLLQTEDYIRAITTANFPGAGAEETDRRVALRTARQQLLTRPGAPEYWVVMDETVLRRSIGGPSIMRAQIAHLIET